MLDRLGPRWRRSARLAAAPVTEPTPATLPMAARDETDERMIPTAMPRRVAAAGAAGAVMASARPRDGRSARHLARSALLVMALAVAVTAALALGSGSGGQSGSSGVRTAPAAAPTGAAPTAAPTAAPPRTPSGVGDSQSDDPSDDEEETGEP